MSSDGRNRDLYGESLQRFVRGYLRDAKAAEAIVEEVFQLALASEEVPRPVSPWLYRVARELCIDRLATGARQGDRRLRIAFDAADSRTDSLTQLVGLERAEDLNDALARLSTEHQEVLRLRYAEDLSRSEMAEVLRIPASLVKTRLSEGVRRLRALADG